jgi:CBS domain-containing protein
MTTGRARPALVRDAMRPASVSVDETTTPRRVLAEMDSAGVGELPVVARDGALRGMAVRRDVERRLYDRGDELARAATIAEEPVARATPDEAIEVAVERMLAAELEVLPVLSSSASSASAASPAGRLEGVLVMDDLRRVPGLVDTVADSRRRRAIAAGAGAGKVVAACGLISAALGLALFALWLDGPWYGLPRWVAWVDATVAGLAFVAAVTASAREMISIPVWAISAFGLFFAASMSHAWRAGPWATWVQFLFAVAFLLLAAVLGATIPRRRRARAVTLAPTA